MKERESRLPCISIDVSKGRSFFRGFYQVGVEVN